MPNFQSSINQTLSTIGALATFSPGLQDHAENMAEKRKIKKEEKALNEQGKAMASSNIRVREVEDDLINRRRELERRKFELKPSAETYSEYAKTIPIIIPEDPEFIHMERMADVEDKAIRDAEYKHAYKEAYNKEFSRLDKMSQAMDRAGRQSEAKKTQRRNFLDYISSMPTSLGGTVGQLPKDMQKQIASTYTKSQRKTVMDRMDKEKANGNSK